MLFQVYGKTEFNGDVEVKKKKFISGRIKFDVLELDDTHELQATDLLKMQTDIATINTERGNLKVGKSVIQRLGLGADCPETLTLAVTGNSSFDGQINLSKTRFYVNDKVYTPADIATKEDIKTKAAELSKEISQLKKGETNFTKLLVEETVTVGGDTGKGKITVNGKEVALKEETAQKSDLEAVKKGTDSLETPVVSKALTVGSSTDKAVMTVGNSSGTITSMRISVPEMPPTEEAKIIINSLAELRNNVTVAQGAKLMITDGTGTQQEVATKADVQSTTVTQVEKLGVGKACDADAKLDVNGDVKVKGKVLYMDESGVAHDKLDELKSGKIKFDKIECEGTITTNGDFRAYGNMYANKTQIQPLLYLTKDEDGKTWLHSKEAGKGDCPTNSDLTAVDTKVKAIENGTKNLPALTVNKERKEGDCEVEVCGAINVTADSKGEKGTVKCTKIAVGGADNVPAYAANVKGKLHCDQIDCPDLASVEDLKTTDKIKQVGINKICAADKQLDVAGVADIGPRTSEQMDKTRIRGELELVPKFTVADEPEKSDKTALTVNGKTDMKNDLTVSGTTTTDNLTVTNKVTIPTLTVQKEVTVPDLKYTPKSGKDPVSLADTMEKKADKEHTHTKINNRLGIEAEPDTSDATKYSLVTQNGICVGNFDPEQTEVSGSHTLIKGNIDIASKFQNGQPLPLNKQLLNVYVDTVFKSDVYSTGSKMQALDFVLTDPSSPSKAGVSLSKYTDPTATVRHGKLIVGNVDGEEGYAIRSALGAMMGYSSAAAVDADTLSPTEYIDLDEDEDIPNGKGYNYTTNYLIGRTLVAPDKPAADRTIPVRRTDTLFYVAAASSFSGPILCKDNFTTGVASINEQTGALVNSTTAKFAGYVKLISNYVKDEKTKKETPVVVNDTLLDVYGKTKFRGAIDATGQTITCDKLVCTSGTGGGGTIPEQVEILGIGMEPNRTYSLSTVNGILIGTPATEEEKNTKSLLRGKYFIASGFNDDATPVVQPWQTLLDVCSASKFRGTINASGQELHIKHIGLEKVIDPEFAITAEKGISIGNYNIDTDEGSNTFVKGFLNVYGKLDEAGEDPVDLGDDDVDLFNCYGSAYITGTLTVPKIGYMGLQEDGTINKSSTLIAGDITIGKIIKGATSKETGTTYHHTTTTITGDVAIGELIEEEGGTYHASQTKIFGDVRIGKVIKGTQTDAAPYITTTTFYGNNVMVGEKQTEFPTLEVQGDLKINSLWSDKEYDHALWVAGATRLSGKVNNIGGEFSTDDFTTYPKNTMHGRTMIDFERSTDQSAALVPADRYGLETPSLYCSDYAHIINCLVVGNRKEIDPGLADGSTDDYIFYVGNGEEQAKKSARINLPTHFGVTYYPKGSTVPTCDYPNFSYGSLKIIPCTEGKGGGWPGVAVFAPSGEIKALKFTQGVKEGDEEESSFEYDYNPNYQTVATEGDEDAIYAPTAEKTPSICTSGAAYIGDNIITNGEYVAVVNSANTEQKTLIRNDSIETGTITCSDPLQNDVLNRDVATDVIVCDVILQCDNGNINVKGMKMLFHRVTEFMIYIKAEEEFSSVSTANATTARNSTRCNGTIKITPRVGYEFPTIISPSCTVTKNCKIKIHEKSTGKVTEYDAVLAFDNGVITIEVILADILETVRGEGKTLTSFGFSDITGFMAAPSANSQTKYDQLFNF